MIAFLANLAFNAVELVIFVGVILMMVCQVTRANWTRHPLVKGLMLAARLLCAPVRQIMKGMGIPTAPLDFSPVITVVLLRIVQGFVVWILRLLP